MQSINIICVGGLNEPYLKEGCAEYLKRMSPYAKVTVTELSEVRPTGQGEGAAMAALKKEGDRILAGMEGAFCVALCVEGELMDSPSFANLLKKAALSGRSKMAFIIGSSHGLDADVKRKADLCLSFSPMTLPHKLMRLVLLEQLYRAFSINAGSKYHK